MHPDIEKLINIAKESGELTEKQKEIILRKAEKLGEDVDEVEMILEMVQKKSVSKESTSSSEKKMKCPNCGAIILDTALVCPECGFVLDKENNASLKAREQIEVLQTKLNEISNPGKQALLINTFTMPVTKEGLSQFLELAYSNYASIGTAEKDIQREPIRNAWKGKCLQAYNALLRLGETDPSVRTLLNRYKPLLEKEEKKKSAHSKIKRIILLIVILVAIPFLANEIWLYYDDFRVEKYWNSVHINECLQQHDYQGARSFAKTQQQKDEITEQEVTYLLSIDDIDQAKVTVLMIKDDTRREFLQSKIKEIEVH